MTPTKKFQVLSNSVPAALEPAGAAAFTARGNAVTEVADAVLVGIERERWDRSDQLYSLGLSAFAKVSNPP